MNSYRLQNEGHFYSIFTRLMKQILIDRSRTRKPRPISLQELGDSLAPDAHTAGRRMCAERSIDVRNAFDRLRVRDATAAETLWLRSVEGLAIEEVGHRQNRKPWRVRADEDFAFQWMRQILKRH
jgi:hypothetical protein